MRDYGKPFRNRRLEADWLLDIRRHADLAGIDHPDPATFPRGVLARLDAHGQHIVPRPLHRLLTEAEEEALDLPAWLIVALQAHPTTDVQTRQALIRAAVHAYGAHAALARIEAEGR